MTSEQNSQSGARETLWQGSVSFEKTSPERDAEMFQKIAAFTLEQGGLASSTPTECRFRNSRTVWQVGVILPGSVEAWPYRRDMEGNILGKSWRDLHMGCHLQQVFAPSGTTAELSRMVARMQTGQPERPGAVPGQSYSAIQSRITR